MTRGSADDRLFEAWCRGDRQAGNRLVARNEALVRGYFRRNPVPNAEDAMQNVWAAIARARHTFQWRSSFRTFLFSVVRNTAYEAQRSGRRDRRYQSLVYETTQGVAAEPGTALQGQRDAESMAAALADLPRDAQWMLAMVYFERRSGPQIAEAIGVPTNTARSRLRRAKQMLRHSLRRWASAPPDMLGAGPLEAWAAEVGVAQPSS